MMSGSIFIILLLLLFTAHPAAAFDFIPKPYSLNLAEIRPTAEEAARGVQFSHYIYTPDSLSGDLIIQCNNYAYPRDGGYRCNLIVQDDRNRIVVQINSLWPVYDIQGRDVNGDGRQELIISYRGDTLAGIRIYDAQLADTISEYVMLERDYRWRQTEKWSQNIGIGPVVENVSPGKRGLLLRMNAGFGRMPKGLMMIDPLSGTEIWHHWIGGSVTNDVLADSVDGLGRCIIFATYASANGAEWEGTDDSQHSYLVASDLQGNWLWKTTFEGTFAGLTRLFPVSHRNSPLGEILAFYSIVGRNDAPQRLMRINARDGSIRQEVPLTTVHSSGYLQPWNTRADTIPVYLITTIEDGVCSYDENLKLSQPWEKVRPAMIVADLDGNGDNEMICPLGTKEFAVLDPRFRMVAKYPAVPTGGSCVQHVRGSRFAQLWMSTADGIARFTVTPTPFYVWQIILRIVLLSTLPLVLVYGSWRVVKWRIAAVKAREDKQRTDAWSAMASKLAHDIRTPLSVLRLSSQNLEMELEAKYHSVPEELRHYFRTFTEEADRLSNVSRAFLTFARQAPPILEPVDLAGLLRRIVERRPHPEGVTVELDLEPGLPHVNVDPQQIITLIENLLANSYRSMKNGGTLIIRLYREQLLHSKGTIGRKPPTEKRTDWVVIEVQDTGCGIAPQDLPRVFEPYFTRSEGGTGIGLVIAKKIAEDHGGAISLTSTFNVGTTATVRLPFTRENLL